MIERYVSPSELKRLLSALLVVLLFLALLAMFAFLVLPGIRNANTPAIDQANGAAAGPVGGVSGWLDPTDYPAERGRTVPPVDPATVMTPTPAMLARGQSLYATNCGSCHGTTGEGDGPAGKGLNPSPRRFTSKDNWVNGTRVDAIFRTLDQGIKGSAMVSYANLTKRDRMALVHYVRSLGKFDHGPEDPKALAELTELFAHSGEVIPNRIPVAAAMARLAAEYRRPTELSPAVVALDPGITDPFRAAQTLAGLPGWAGSDQALATGLALNPADNGFAPAVALYSADQWRALRNDLQHPAKEVKP